MQMMGVNPVSDASSSGRSNQRKGRYHERQNGKKLGELTGFTFQRHLEQLRQADHNDLPNVKLLCG